jgi:hypothetical protein
VSGFPAGFRPHEGGGESLRPEFARQLRAELVAAASAQIAERQAADEEHASVVPKTRRDRAADAGGRGRAAHGVPPRRTRRTDRGRGRRTGRGPLVWAAASASLAAAGALIVGVLPAVLDPESVQVRASSVLTGAVSADPAGPIRLNFDRSLDRGSVQAALRLTPAATVRTSWEGDTLTVTAVNGLAPNSAYRLTVDARTARSAAGQPLGSDLELAFGTAPTPDGATPAAERTTAPAGSGPSSAAASSAAQGLKASGTASKPQPLRRTVVAPALASSEAVVTRTGALLLTAARASGASGLVRTSEKGTTPRRLAADTPAVAISRSRLSVAFAAPGGITLADAEGTPQGTVAVAVDPGSPLGWMDDDEVALVSGGRLVAVDRHGRRRDLWREPVDVSRQTVVIAPGGRYAYLGDADGGAGGRLLDLSSGTARPLNGAVTEPAFTADGAGVLWMERSADAVRLRQAPAGGGPVMTATLPVAAGEKVSDLAVAPDGTRIVYSVPGQLRLASLPSGVTLAAADGGPGRWPRFSPSGSFVTVLGDGTGGPRIETVVLPSDGGVRPAVAEAVARAFATAQLDRDTGAQRWLSRRGTALPALPSSPTPSRAAVVRSEAVAGGAVAVTVRLTADASPDRPRPLQAEETLTVADAGRTTDGRPVPVPKVVAAKLGAFAPAPEGPQLLRVDRWVPSAGGGGEQVLLTFDSDLDPASVSAGVRVARTDAGALPTSAPPVAAARTVLVMLPAAARDTTVRISLDGVRDVDGGVTAVAAVDVRPTSAT